MENIPLLSNNGDPLTHGSAMRDEVLRLTDSLQKSQSQMQLKEKSMLAHQNTERDQCESLRQTQKRLESAEEALLQCQLERTGQEDHLVEAIEELDRERGRLKQECEGLKELLSVERDRSAQAAIDLDSHVTTSRRRCEELEQALQASRDECDNARRELETAQAAGDKLSAQLHELGSLHRRRCDELAASLSAAEEGRKATQLQLEEALRDVIGVKTQLQGSMERDAAACARASVLEAQLAVSDAAASVELDRVRRNHAQECEGLKELLCSERLQLSQLQCQLRFIVCNPCVVKECDTDLNPCSLFHQLSYDSRFISMNDADTQTDIECIRSDIHEQSYRV